MPKTPYRDWPIMDIVNRMRSEWGNEQAAEQILGLYEEANSWHKTAESLSRGCAELQSKLDLATQSLDRQARQLVSLGDTIDEQALRLNATVEQNRFLRNWIRQLRDTQEERGEEPADRLYSMLLERIEPLMNADPATDSIDGARLLELVALCEAYEKRNGEWPAVVERHEHNWVIESRASLSGLVIRETYKCECGAFKIV